MANYAVININNQVVNVIVAESLEIAQQATGANCVELLPGAGIGDIWDGTVFTTPVEEPTE